MGWSTRELAEIAGTTVKTVRHYHSVGLLDEPERRANGYKTYGPEHLARLLRIQRMREIGFSIPRVIEVMGSDATSEETTRELLAEVESSMRRLETIRQDLLASLGSADQSADEFADYWAVPRGFAGFSGNLSEEDRVMLSVQSRHFTDEALGALRGMSASSDPIDVEFADLPEDASDERIADLAARMAPMIRRARAEHPMPDDVVSGGAAGERRASRSIGAALSRLYNPAQLRVIIRSLSIAEEAE